MESKPREEVQAAIADFINWATTYTDGTDSTAPFLWNEYDDDEETGKIVRVRTSLRFLCQGTF